MTIQVLNTTEEALNKFRNQPDKRDCYTEKEFFFRYMSYPDGFRYSMQNCLYESVWSSIRQEIIRFHELPEIDHMLIPFSDTCTGELSITCFIL